MQIISKETGKMVVLLFRANSHLHPMSSGQLINSRAAVITHRLININELHKESSTARIMGV